MLKRLLIVSLLCAPMIAAADFTVGMAVRSYRPAHPRHWRGASDQSLRTMIWYPAAAGAAVQTIDFPPVFAGADVAPEAASAAQVQSFPLLVMSHGTGGSAASMAWIGAALAAHGFIVAAVDHPGNNALAPLTAEGFGLWWERAQDLRDLLDALLADPQWAALVDRDRIGAIGFSLGGYSVLELAGARTDRQAFQNFCLSPQADAICTPPEMLADKAAAKTLDQTKETLESLSRSGNSFRDSRVRAVFTMAPALAMAFGRQGLAEIAVPVSIVAGDADQAVPVETNAKRYAKLIPKADLTLLPDVGHYAFLDVCLPTGVAMLPLYCQDKAGVDRASIHRRTIELAVAFFDRELAGH